MKASHSRARAKIPRIQWVEQVDKGGCGIACLAMLLGVTYARIVEWAPEFCGKCGLQDDQVDQFLSEHGYALQRVWEYREFDARKREIWPPRPFAQKHLCSVMQTNEDSIGHFVVMDGKGVVYDPALPAFAPKTLLDFHEVEWVAGCYPAR